MLREVTDGAAVLEGPNGTWTVRRGDTVPGVGRGESEQRVNFDAVIRLVTGRLVPQRGTRD